MPLSLVFNIFFYIDIVYKSHFLSSIQIYLPILSSRLCRGYERSKYLLRRDTRSSDFFRNSPRWYSTHHPRPLWNNDIYIPSETARSMPGYYEGITVYIVARCAITSDSRAVCSRQQDAIYRARTWYILSFKSMPIVNEQISAIYDNCKSRQRASGILCKCQRRTADDKQIERARLSGLE